MHFHSHGKGALFELLIRLAIDYGPPLTAWMVRPPSGPVLLGQAAGLTGLLAWRAGQGPPADLDVGASSQPVWIELIFVSLAFLLAVWPVFAYTRLFFLTYADTGIGGIAGFTAVALLGFALRAYYVRAAREARGSKTLLVAPTVFSSRPAYRPDGESP